MEKKILWDECINTQFSTASEEQLDSFVALLEYIEENDLKTLVSDELYISAELWEWLSSKAEINLNDIKREIQKKLSKATKVTQTDYERISQNIGILTNIKTLVLHLGEEKAFFISTLKDYYIALREYLIMEKKNDFCEDMAECFPEIYFVEDIGTTINTLNRGFSELREEIVEHLTAINNYHSKFAYLLSMGKSNQEIAQEFSADTNVDCSPQAGREGVQNLKLSCYNVISKQMENIKCELHTKFKKFNIDRTKQDRIYFFPGKPGIKEGKIIVKHIGKHL